MRTMFLAIILSSACASGSTSKGPQPVNVALVRHEISGEIRAHFGNRSIHSMGRVRADRAVVYTTSPAGEKQEETWVKSSAGWHLEAAIKLSSAL